MSDDVGANESWWAEPSDKMGLYLCDSTNKAEDKSDKMSKLHTKSPYVIFSCPAQLNGWPCHSITQWRFDFSTVELSIDACDQLNIFVTYWMVEQESEKWEELSSCAPWNSFHTSDSEAKMGDELTLLLEVFHKVEKAGGQATLSLATVGGKTKMKLEIGTTPEPPNESSSTSSPTGRRHRQRGPWARACRN